MKEISNFVLLPLMIALEILALSDGARERVLSFRAARTLENALKKAASDGRLYWAAFALCMAVGVFARCWRFGELPRGFNQDGVMAGVEAYCLSTGGTDQYGTSWPTYFQAWGYSQMSTLYSYLLIPFIRLLGLSRFTYRLPMLLVSLAMLPLAWDFARRIAGRGYALLTLFLLAVNPWQILQSRWALEANLMPHVLLTAAYLLYIGRYKRWALYLSMVFFALTVYAYGLACFVLPLLMLGMAAYYLVKGYIKAGDLFLCVAIFSLIAGPYIATMVINAFGLQTMRLGPITMPRFEDSMRSNDMVFAYPEIAYQMAIENIRSIFDGLGLGSSDATYNAVDWAHAMYRFAVPLYVAGAFLLWRDRRRLAAQGRREALCTGGMLLLLWLAGAIMRCVLSGGGGIINHHNSLYYSLIFFAAYLLYRMGKRLRAALTACVAVFTAAFVALCGTYFFDKDYINSVAWSFHDGLQEALLDTWDWDYDHYYLTTLGRSDGVMQMTSNVMFAHRIDYSQRAERTDLVGPDGQPSGWYFTERYIFTDFSDFVPDPMDCAVYIVTQGEKGIFDPNDYLITDYGGFAVVYPRYWAE